MDSGMSLVYNILSIIFYNIGAGIIKQTFMFLFKLKSVIFKRIPKMYSSGQYVLVLLRDTVIWKTSGDITVFSAQDAIKLRHF